MTDTTDLIQRLRTAWTYCGVEQALRFEAADAIEQQAAELDALKRDIESLLPDLTAANVEIEQQAAQIAEKDAEIAALRADAERYRWWREYGLTTESEHRSIENELLPAGEIFRTLNDAIDAALRQEQPHG